MPQRRTSMAAIAEVRRHADGGGKAREGEQARSVEGLSRHEAQSLWACDDDSQRPADLPSRRRAESAIPPIAASASRRIHPTSTATMSPRASASSGQTLTASMVIATAWGASRERAFRNANARPHAARIEAPAAVGRCGHLMSSYPQPGQPASPGRVAPTRSTEPRPQIAFLLERGTT